MDRPMSITDRFIVFDRLYNDSLEDLPKNDCKRITTSKKLVTQETRSDQVTMLNTELEILDIATEEA